MDGVPGLLAAAISSHVGYSSRLTRATRIHSAALSKSYHSCRNILPLHALEVHLVTDTFHRCQQLTKSSRDSPSKSGFKCTQRLMLRRWLVDTTTMQAIVLVNRHLRRFAARGGEKDLDHKRSRLPLRERNPYPPLKSNAANLARSREQAGQAGHHSCARRHPQPNRPHAHHQQGPPQTDLYGERHPPDRNYLPPLRGCGSKTRRSGMPPAKSSSRTSKPPAAAREASDKTFELKRSRANQNLNVRWREACARRVCRRFGFQRSSSARRTVVTRRGFVTKTACHGGR